MSEPTMGPPSERLLQAAARAAAPEPVYAAWNAAPPEPAAGQLWRARWGSAAHLVVLLSAVWEGVVTVAPASMERRLLDEESVLLPPEASDLERLLVVWIGLAREVPVRVLDRSPGALRVDVETLQDAARGPEIESPIDPRELSRARLLDLLDALVAASWSPPGTGSLQHLLSALKPAEIAVALSCPPYRALELARGQQTVTASEADALAPLVGVSPAELLQANPPVPAELVSLMDWPRRRAQVERLAERKGLSVPAAWREAAYDIAGLAARQTGDSVPAWEGRIDQYFAAVLDE